jgi:vacuolar protein sorting-associated protein 8
VAEDGQGDEPANLDNAEEVIGNHEKSIGSPEGGRVVELLEEERAGAITPIANGFSGKDYRTFQGPDEASENGSVDQAPRRVESPSGSILSNPDDSPSVQVSLPHLQRDALANRLGFCSVFSRK